MVHPGSTEQFFPGRHQHRPAACLLGARRRDPPTVAGQRPGAQPRRRGAAGDRGGAHRGLQRARCATVPGKGKGCGVIEGLG